MRRLPTLLIASSILLLPSLAGAVEVGGGLRVQGGYDDNVFFRPKGAEKDGSFQLTPFVNVNDKDGILQYHLQYEPTREQYVDHTDLNGWDQLVDADGSWKVTPKLTLKAFEEFRRFRTITQLNETVASGGQTSLALVDTREPYNNNTAGLELDYLVTPTQLVTIGGNYTIWNFDNDERRDRSFLTAKGGYQYALTERLWLGGSTTWTRQEFDKIGILDKSTTDYLNFSALVDLKLAPTLSIHVSAGPAIILPDKAGQPPTSAVTQFFPTFANGTLVDITTCETSDGVPVLVNCSSTGTRPSFNSLIQVPFVGALPKDPDNTVTYFADASITKTWERWQATASYQRRDDQSAGLGVSSVSDYVNSVVNWTPFERFTFTVRGSWLRRKQEQTVNQTVIGLAPFSTSNIATATSLRNAEVKSGGLEVVTWEALLGANYRITRNFTAFSRVIWQLNQSKGSASASDDASRFIFRAGVEYRFDPLRF